MLVLDDLTVPTRGATTARRLFGEYLRHVTRSFLALDGAGAAALGPVTAWAAALLRNGRPGPLLCALRRPTISVLVRLLSRATARGVPPDPAWADELAATLALELALSGERPPRPFEQPCPRVLCALGHRRALALPAGARLAVGLDGARILDGEATVHLTEARAEPPVVELDGYHAIDDDLVLASIDNNPLSSVEAHPDKTGSQVDLGGRPIGEWVESLRAALALVRGHLPAIADEIALGLSQVVPVGFATDRHESASYAEAVGTVYLSLHPDPLTLAEALIHEHAHNKLNALGALGPLLQETEATFVSPVRPDPRPLHGVLLAVHAFVPVALLYERLREARDPRALAPAAERRFLQVVRNNREGTRTLLRHARPSPSGEALLAELARWDEHFSGV